MTRYSLDERKWIGLVNRWCFGCKSKMRVSSVTYKEKGKKHKMYISVCYTCNLRAELGKSRK